MRRLAGLAVLLLLAFGSGVVRADDPSTRYRLRKDSNFQEGCFDPCACPVRIFEPLEGRFVLEPAGSDWLFRYFRVLDVEWRAGSGSAARRVRGSGTYRVGGEFAVQHQMTLDLQIDGGPIEKYDSGLVLGGGGFPRIDVTISLHGVFCYDRVFELHARPAPDVAVDASALSWLPVVDAAGFDVVQGNLALLRATGGDFSQAATHCVANDLGGTSTFFDDVPEPGQAFFFVVRFEDDQGAVSYDDDMREQPVSRDPGIDASLGACP
jgi:hypothetical protein